MKTSRQIKRDKLAKKAYALYCKYLSDGMTNQQAIDKARMNSSILVSDRTMRNYIQLMQQ